MIKNTDFKNKVIQGDCFVEMDKLIEQGIKIDLIVIDPPYEISVIGGGTINNVKKLNKSLNDGVVKANLHKGFNYKELFTRLDKLQDKTNIYIFCSKKQLMTYMNKYVTEKECTFDILHWFKNNALPTYSNKYLSDCELLLHFRKGASCHPKSYKDAQTIYFGSINYKDKKIWGHPTIKPVDLIEKIIRNSSNEGDLVLDCFAGSGTTGLAAKNLNRNFILIEKEKEYVDTIYKRLGA